MSTNVSTVIDDCPVGGKLQVDQLGNVPPRLSRVLGMELVLLICPELDEVALLFVCPFVVPLA